MFSPSDILYIVLAFCVLWLTAGLFWLITQLAIMLRNVNETMMDAQKKLALIEEAIVGIKTRVERATSSSRFIFDGLKSVVEYAVEKRHPKKSRSARGSTSSEE